MALKQPDHMIDIVIILPVNFCPCEIRYHDIPKNFKGKIPDLVGKYMLTFDRTCLLNLRIIITFKRNSSTKQKIVYSVLL